MPKNLFSVSFFFLHLKRKQAKKCISICRTMEKRAKSFKYHFYLPSMDGLLRAKIMEICLQYINSCIRVEFVQISAFVRMNHFLKRSSPPTQSHIPNQHIHIRPLPPSHRYNYMRIVVCLEKIASICRCVGVRWRGLCWR